MWWIKEYREGGAAAPPKSVVYKEEVYEKGSVCNNHKWFFATI